MKFTLHTSSEFYEDSDIEKYKTLGFTFTENGRINDRRIAVCLEINTLEELMEFAKQWGALIISDGRFERKYGSIISEDGIIEIYDGRRE
jgi:hypothetical protein